MSKAQSTALLAAYFMMVSGEVNRRLREHIAYIFRVEVY
jgi:hypothetical protein